MKLNIDQQKVLCELGLELIRLDYKNKNSNSANAIDLIVNIIDNNESKGDYIELKDLQKLSIYTSSYGAWMQADNEGDYYAVKDVENLLKEIGYLNNLNLKNDSYRHDIIFKGVNITYRLSVTKSHFWIYNIDTGQEIQYIGHDNGFPNLHENWESFIEDFWNEILEDMK